MFGRSFGVQGPESNEIEPSTWLNLVIGDGTGLHHTQLNLVENMVRLNDLWKRTHRGSSS